MPTRLVRCSCLLLSVLHWTASASATSLISHSLDLDLDLNSISLDISLHTSICYHIHIQSQYSLVPHNMAYSHRTRLSPLVSNIAHNSTIGHYHHSLNQCRSCHHGVNTSLHHTHPCSIDCHWLSSSYASFHRSCDLSAHHPHRRSHCRSIPALVTLVSPVLYSSLTLTIDLFADYSYAVILVSIVSLPMSSHPSRTSCIWSLVVILISCSMTRIWELGSGAQAKTTLTVKAKRNCLHLTPPILRL